MLTIADLIEALTNTRPAAPQIISEASIDSRQVIPASLFIALKGENSDGHLFVKEAIQRGAQAVLIEKVISPDLPVLDLRNGTLPPVLPSFDEPVCLLVNNSLKALQTIAAFWRNKLNLRVIGITGSVGKSTTKELVSEVLSYRYRTLKNIGNLNNEIGLPLTILRLSENHQKAVLEMGFYVPGEIQLLCEIAKPVVGVITNIGTVHAERAGSQEIIAHGKAELIESLPENGIAILNYDDPWVKPMAEKTNAKVLFYGLDPSAHLWADQIEGLGLQGIRFRLHYKNEQLHLRVPLIGRHSVHTALRLRRYISPFHRQQSTGLLLEQLGHQPSHVLAVHKALILTSHRELRIYFLAILPGDLGLPLPNQVRHYKYRQELMRHSEH